MKISALTQQELLVQVEVSVKAALTLPELQSALQAIGMSADQVKVGLNLVKEVSTWQTSQTATANNVRQTQKTLRIAKEKVVALYARHLEAARYMFRDEEELQYALQLAGPRHTRYAKWHDQVRAFYNHLPPKALEPLKILDKEINEVKKILEQLPELQVLRNDARRQAQETTHAKQMAIYDLRQWFRRFVKAAEFACQDTPQLLESMGIMVASS
uniref:Uncharacterized protein n=1 Tax=Roseihalotalea indica TaxID=2867963 RepID=A0AA49JDL2_9BACT|nr:hypothetical protein K4G66_27190 [Tunicatimonas sp. TK19036]